MNDNEFLLDILTHIHKVAPRTCPMQYLASIYWDPTVATWQESYTTIQVALRDLFSRGCLKDHLEPLSPGAKIYYVITSELTDIGITAINEKKLPEKLK